MCFAYTLLCRVGDAASLYSRVYTFRELAMKNASEYIKIKIKNHKHATNLAKRVMTLENRNILCGNFISPLLVLHHWKVLAPLKSFLTY